MSVDISTDITTQSEITSTEASEQSSIDGGYTVHVVSK